MTMTSRRAGRPLAESPASRLRAVRSRLFWSVVWPRIRRFVERTFHTALLLRTTNFTQTRWLGRPIRQNVLDLWTIQETIAALRPAVIIETGTFEGGSALFYADLLDRLGGAGRVVTIDSAPQSTPPHPRVTYLLGDSTSRAVIDRVMAAVAQAAGPVMVILDSDHSEGHVARELDAYSPVVTPGSFLLVQDGAIDRLGYFRAFRPGPCRAIERFLAAHAEFEIDRERCGRFLITDHPNGWLRRRADEPS